MTCACLAGERWDRSGEGIGKGDTLGQVWKQLKKVVDSMRLCDTVYPMSEQYVAYDYEHQQWIRGELARHLLIEQAEELLALLRGERGQEYVNFAYPANDLESLIEQTENDLLRLKRTAAVTQKG